MKPLRWLILWLHMFAAVSAYSQTANADKLAGGLPVVNAFAGDTGKPLSWDEVIAAMDRADIVLIGESHVDARAHAIQIELIKVAVRRWPELTLSLEEFDRSQQEALDAFARDELTGEELKEMRAFVDLSVKENWDQWYLPKLSTARDAGVPLLASNSPLKYSRIVRNYGCDGLPELTAAERALFECPSVPLDPAYLERFGRTFKQAVRGSQATGLKELSDEQLRVLFRAHRVWDATMADSIATARSTRAGKVLHLVGGFHAEYDGGLVQELRARDEEAQILVINMASRGGSRLAANDMGEADVVVYTRSLKSNSSEPGR